MKNTGNKFPKIVEEVRGQENCHLFRYDGIVNYWMIGLGLDIHFEDWLLRSFTRNIGCNTSLVSIKNGKLEVILNGSMQKSSTCMTGLEK